MRIQTLILTTTLLLASIAVAHPAEALDVYVNGVKATGLKNADMVNCIVKFDAQGNIHIISPGYTVATSKEGAPLRIDGSSDFGKAKHGIAAKPKSRYVLMYKQNPRVGFSFEVFVNGLSFREIGLDSNEFTVDISDKLHAGSNIVRVVGKPTGTGPQSGSEADIAELRIFQGHVRDDGAFVAKYPPVWELIRAAVDRAPIDRSTTIEAE